ncbi:MAG: hypothetical protein EOT05_00835 [Candidatus Microsaccharimonas sossegonensis]|uniref:Uncharacterized protein n=1 Tax=Candidatus Microsaccharimonas sossegonensis TaxID=2506948 RepID=A0A4Q0AGL1_9BACT|nr:MAG: hypothetical protein EOT05_00835 [Candidatus Microsaccharimonas sossegonensis]
MIDKRRVRKKIKDLQRIKTWQLLVLFILAVFIAATFLRLNNIGMVERRAAVIAADKAGNEAVIIQRLYDLQQYVSAHMNTDLGKGVYLESTYQRVSQAAINTASNDQNPNGNIYKKAQEVCAPRFSSYSTAYLLCTTSELAKYPSSSNLVGTVKLPSSSVYVRDYESPLWSPDFAGWSVVVCVVLGLMILARLLSLAILKLMLRRHYRSV